MMEKAKQNGFLGKHAKSSALVVSLVLHALLIVAAVSFVAVKIIIKEDTGFETKQVNRPKMPIKKLQVPVKVKRRPQPKLRKQIMVKNRTDRKMPEIKMPEIMGIKGGLGSTATASGAGMGGVGFSIPEINIFGVKSKAERIFILLDASAEMMYDEMGGIEAYTLIKEELGRIVGELPSTVLFNVAVFQGGNRQKVLFPSLVNVSESNVEAMKKWIKPLNAASVNMSARDFGIKTLGPGGRDFEEIKVEPIQSYGNWVNPALLAMKQQADSVYLLTCQWGPLYHRLGNQKGTEAEIQKWDELYVKAKNKLKKENDARRGRGKPPRILKGKMSIIKAYFPDAKPPGHKITFNYTPKIMTTALTTVRNEYAPPAISSGLSKKNRSQKYSFNVIHFVRQPNAGTDRTRSNEEKSREKLKQMTRLCHGKYRSLSGLEAIQSSIAQEEAGE